MRQAHFPDFAIPDSFFLSAGVEEDFCIFLISCLSKDRFIHLDPNFSYLTGYSNERFMKEGMDFWFSLICPEDMPAVTTQIIASHKALFDPNHDPRTAEPLVLEYRFQHADGSWVWARDTRYLVSFSQEKVIDKVLCRLETLPAQAAELKDLSLLLSKEKSCTKMLEQAMVHQTSQRKRSLGPEGSSNGRVNPSLVNELTKREKEILQLIAQGLSTKMIAERCSISIHTVETHRRHLLEKLQVKNSVELIKEASKVFWL